MVRHRVTRSLFSLMLVLMFWFALPGCGGSGSDSIDGDEPTCPDGEAYINGRCIPVDGDTIFPDGDTTDGDVTDGDVNDGDITDGDIIDGDGGGDIDWTVPDGDDDVIERDIEGQEDFIEQDEPYCQCETDADCGIEGYICDGCFCVADTDGDDDCISCFTTASCPDGSFCDPATDCCNPYFRPECDNHLDCPDWAYCSPLGECDYECMEDADCAELYTESHCCVDRGRCAPPTICESGTDIECAGCSDCRDELGEGYYCSVDSGTCQPGSCCADSDCTDGANGTCNLHNGTCAYFSDPEAGSISGTVFMNAGAASFVFKVEVRDNTGEVVRDSGDLFPEAEGQDYSASYGIGDLAFGSYTVVLVVEEFPGLDNPYPFNPVVLSADNRTVSNADFYFGLPDPRLGTISGSVFVNAPFTSDTVSLTLSTLEGGSSLVELDTIVAGDLSGGSRPFTFSGLSSGSYFVSAELTHSAISVNDYYSAPITLNISDEQLASVDGVALYFGSSGAGLGRISGTIHHADYYSASSFGVWLYSAVDYPYPVAEAGLMSVDATSTNYAFENVEAGEYWLRGEAAVRDFTITGEPTAPLNMTLVEGAGTQLDNRDLYFDTIRNDLGSISGNLAIYENIFDYEFSVKVYAGNWDNLLREDPVVLIDYGASAAPFFVESLPVGDYYLKAVGSFFGDVIEVELDSPVTVPSTSPEKDVTGVTITFTESR